MTRGLKQQRDLFVDFLYTKMLEWKRKNIETGKDEVVQVQGGLRPIELWEYVFPEECYDEVMTMLKVDGCKDTGSADSVGNKAKLLMLRKMLGAKPLKKFKKVPTNKYVERRGVALHPIGIKADVRAVMKKRPGQEYSKSDYSQEML